MFFFVNASLVNAFKSCLNVHMLSQSGDKAYSQCDLLRVESAQRKTSVRIVCFILHLE